jgi:hypothetical protein
MSDPGRGAGESLALSAAPFSRLSAHRAIGRRGHRAGLAVQTTAHESEAKTVYFGVSGNERGKSVHSAALTWHREPHAGGPRRWRYGLGLEFANWDDDHSLLNDPSGKPVEGGFETGLLAHIGGTADIAPGARLVLGAEKAYWSRIGLGEVRFILGVEISP